MLFNLRCFHFSCFLPSSLLQKDIPRLHSLPQISLTLKSLAWFFPHFSIFHGTFKKSWNLPSIIASSPLHQTLSNLRRGKHLIFMKHHHRALIILVLKPETKKKKDCTSHNDGYITTTIHSAHTYGPAVIRIIYSFILNESFHSFILIISFITYSKVVLWVKEQIWEVSKQTCLNS